MTRRRRDPHAERASMRIGPSGRPRAAIGTARPRVNPHAAALAEGAHGRLRRDPHGIGAGTPQRPRPRVEARASVRVIDEPTHLVLAVPELLGERLDAADRALIAAARRLAEPDGAVVVAAFGGDVATLAAAGADRIVSFPAALTAEARGAALLRVARDLAPRHALFRPVATGGGHLARSLAAGLGERPAIGVWRLARDEVIGRGAGVDLRGPPPRVLVLHETRLAAAAAVEPGEGRALHVVMEPVACAVEVLGEVAADPDRVPLAEAELIVSAGQGVTDWAAFRSVAAALGGVIGGSRVVCDRGLLPRDRQVGASGTLVAPRCYLAFGISGAPQHLDGIARCERVVAVDTDLHAKMIERADLAIVADAQAVMPAILRRLAGQRS